MSAIRRPRSKRHKPNAEINVVPYIDVMMVLLVIFMVTAPMMTQGVNVDLPQAKSDPVESNELSEPLVISVTQSGDFYLELGENNKQPIMLERIGVQVSKILQRAPDTQVLLRGDRAIEYGLIVRIMTVLQQAGAQSVGLVSESP
ncbi:MAG: protein TolR [Oceanospirillaceae bacterium]|jgi:biopolymer transport protein TolR|nr:protein TolR [Oceanospirillaceae bacterium]MBT4441694.1 protein TolR [Oceanospirillaceae bacterium]MBT6076985.1 protein TolR [Oceanospirillaceae bacterium]